MEYRGIAKPDPGPNYELNQPKLTSEMTSRYADDGISGTNTKKREEFNRMIEDCRARKIDRIVTKSISRFARNTVDCLRYTRELKSLNIAVYFEKENIDTLDAKGEVLMTIMAALAQQESESLSANVRLGISFRNQQGKVRINHNRFLGYTKGEDGKLVIVPEEAEIVRRIYAEYLDGKSMVEIRKGLEADGIRNGAGNLRWYETNIRQILTNEKYIGDALLQKTMTVNTLEKKRVNNKGEFPRYYVEGSQEAIIPKDVFLRVAEELERRANLMAAGKKRVYSGKYALTNIVFCSHCGNIYRRINWNSNGLHSVVWRCLSRLDKSCPKCDGRTVNEEALHSAVLEAVNFAFSGNSSAIETVKQSINDTIIEKNVKRLTEIDCLLGVKQAALLDAGQDDERTNAIGTDIEQLRSEKQQLMTDNAVQTDIKNRVDDMMAFLDEQDGKISEYSDQVVRRMVEKITIFDEKITVDFKSGISTDISM